MAADHKFGAASAPPILELETVVAGYGRMMVLHGMTFCVRANCITTIIGPNGAGKSTVFRAIFALTKVQSGDIRFQRNSILGMTQRQLLAAGIAYVPQGHSLFPELSVYQNLELGGISVGEWGLVRERMESVMDRFPILRERARRQASTLSGGELKMLEVGRALLLNPKLLLIDEPSIGLAPKLVATVFEELQALRDSGVTILMVEQNARSALAISDDGLVLEQGRLALAGNAREILDDPRIGSLFLGGGLSGSLQTNGASLDRLK